MNSDREISKGHQESDGPAHDRLDWITKYLELADKIIQDNMPNAPRRRERH